jgi:hypothetical protein
VLWVVLELASHLSPSPSSGITGLNILLAIHQDLIMHQRTKLLDKTVCLKIFVERINDNILVAATAKNDFCNSKNIQGLVGDRKK